MKLCFILGDQLNLNISSLSQIDPQHDMVFMCEVWDEATFVKHHKKKIALIFSAMRHFSEELKSFGFNVVYTRLDDPQNSGSFYNEIFRIIDIYKPSEIVITEPSEYRVLQDMKSWDLNVPIELRSDDRFLCSHQEFANWAKGRKQMRMEFFYREMRKKYGVLIEGSQPVGGAWNYDSENRQPPKDGLVIPPEFKIDPDETTKEVLTLIDQRFSSHFGDLEPFNMAINREQALEVLGKFINERLINFGTYQDAMIENQPWMFHSHISFYLNIGLLLPLECINAAEKAYADGSVPLNAAEGFIRQILGWREFVRGLYWQYMPKYKELNFLEAKRKLPRLFWGGDTQMNCLTQCVKETKENAYAHHIQRLMVLGNFALIAGLDVAEVNEWYLIVYADAFEWVEMPNVSGMVLFADGGIMGSKPYAASGAYINKMSNYCKGCRYKVSKKNGPQACPFNYLYWDFLIRNKEKLQGNNRLAMMYKTIDRFSQEKAEAVKADSMRFLKALDANEKV